MVVSQATEGNPAVSYGWFSAINDYSILDDK